MLDIVHPLLALLGFFAFAAVLLKLSEVASRLIRIKGLHLYFLASAGLLLSGLGWEAYAQGRATIWQALGGSIFLGGLPLWASLWTVAPDLLLALFGCATRQFRKWNR